MARSLSNNPNNTLIANAREDQSIAINELITLTGNNDGVFNDNLNYAWTILAAPNNSIATLSSTNTATTEFTPDFIGNYTLQFSINDGINFSIDLIEIGVQAENGNSTCSSATFDSRPLFLDATTGIILNEDFDSYANGAIVSSLFSGSVVTSSSSIFWGGWGNQPFFQGGSLISEPRNVGTSLTLTFSPPVQAIGANVFDDYDGTPALNNISLTAFTNSGKELNISETSTSFSAGFIGACDVDGISSATFTIDSNSNYEIDHLVISQMP